MHVMYVCLYIYYTYYIYSIILYTYIYIFVYPSRYSTGDMEPTKFEYIYIFYLSK